MVTRDFSLNAYEQYLAAFKKGGYQFTLFRDYIRNPSIAGKICLVRHDVDRKPYNALAMATLEKQMGVSATYYFRYKSGIFVPEIIGEIQQMGHEVGYHYENLSDTDGNHEKGLADFEKNLTEFRKVADVKTISMHGRPFKPYDNRDLWRDASRHQLLTSKFGILGELYLDIDYEDIAYINDTGRNWHSTRNNVRDITNSKVFTNFESGEELLEYLSASPHNKIVFQVHPERWDKDFIPWTKQYLLDVAINSAKQVITLTRRLK